VLRGLLISRFQVRVLDGPPPLSPRNGPFSGEVISTYARTQVIADGVLVDAGPMAKEAGWRWPVVLTAGVWRDCVAWTDADCEAQVYQDPSGRLWDVLFMGAYAIRTHGGGGERLNFSLDRVPRDGCSTEPKRVTLKLIVGPGDDGEPVITILPRSIEAREDKLAPSPGHLG